MARSAAKRARMPREPEGFDYAAAFGLNEIADFFRDVTSFQVDQAGV